MQDVFSLEYVLYRKGGLEGGGRGVARELACHVIPQLSARRTWLVRGACSICVKESKHQGIKAPAPLAVPPVVGYRLYIVTNQLSLTHTHPGMYVDAARYDMMLLLLPRVESVHVWGQRDAQGLSRVARCAECVLYRMCSLWKCDAQDIRIDAYARPFRVAAVAGFDSCYLSLPPSFPPPLPPELSPCA